MSEPNDDQTREITRIFVEKYNKDHRTDFVFMKSDERRSEDYDYLYKNSTDDLLKVQYIESPPCRGRDYVNLKKFERGDICETDVINLQYDYLRARESVGKKQSKRYSTESDLVLLIDFGLFIWDDINLNLMKKAVVDINNEFKNIYCIHVGKEKCERLK